MEVAIAQYVDELKGISSAPSVRGPSSSSTGAATPASSVVVATATGPNLIDNNADDTDSNQTTASSSTTKTAAVPTRRLRKRGKAQRNGVAEASSSVTLNPLTNQVRIDYLGTMIGKGGVPTQASVFTSTSKVQVRIESELVAIAEANALSEAASAALTDKDEGEAVKEKRTRKKRPSENDGSSTPDIAAKRPATINHRHGIVRPLASKSSRLVLPFKMSGPIVRILSITFIWASCTSVICEIISICSKKPTFSIRAIIFPTFDEQLDFTIKHHRPPKKSISPC